MTEIVERLREDWIRLSGQSIDRGCVDSGIAANLADEAADLIEQQAASLAAKDKEIDRLRAGINGVVNFQSGMTRSQVRESCAELLDNKTVGLNNQSPFAEAMLGYKRALAEAVKVLRPFAAQADGPRLCGAEMDDDWKPFLHRTYSDVDITNGHLRAARAFVAQHGSDSREGKS